jgi:hypothetical protein
MAFVALVSVLALGFGTAFARKLWLDVQPLRRDLLCSNCGGIKPAFPGVRRALPGESLHACDVCGATRFRLVLTRPRFWPGGRVVVGTWLFPPEPRPPTYVDGPARGDA